MVQLYQMIQHLLYVVAESVVQTDDLGKRRDLLMLWLWVKVKVARMESCRSDVQFGVVDCQELEHSFLHLCLTCGAIALGLVGVQIDFAGYRLEMADWKY